MDLLWSPVRPGAASTSGRPPRVHWPPSYLDLFDLASMASRSGGAMWSPAVHPKQGPKVTADMLVTGGLASSSYRAIADGSTSS